MRTIAKFALNNPISLIVIAALVGIFIVLGHRANLASGDWGTWTGGIGTVGTLIGTIWLASDQSRKAAKAEMTLARLHAVGMIVRLQVAVHMLDLACAELELVTPENYNGNRLENAKAQMASITEWPLEELMQLAPLPNFVAAKLASARAKIVCFPAFTDSAMRISGSQTPEQRAGHAAILLEEIRTTKSQVESAKSGCIDAAKALNAEG